MMCGSTEIDGYAFCLGLKLLRKSQKLSYTPFPELQSLPSLTDLIERTGLRPKYTTNSLERYSLEIRSLAELVDMFHTRQATDPRDKVYALLGMSSDDPSKAGLQPDYTIAWKELFQQLVKFVLGKDVSVETSSQRAVIKSKGCILGQVSSVRRDDRQNVNITSRNAAWDLGGKTEWTLQTSAKPIQERDIICLLHGASKPTIIRLCKDHFAVVVIAAIPLNRSGSFGWPETSQSTTQFLRDFLLIWDWEKPLGESQDQEEYKALTKTYSQALEYSKAEFGESTRLWNDIMILDDLGEYKNADERLLEAISGYVTAFRKEHLPRLNSQYGRTLLSFVAGEGHEDIVKLLLETVNPDLKDGKSGRTPLSWAAENGHEAVVKLLLLLETGKVEADSEDEDGRTPLWYATENGHEAVVKLLLETGKVEADSKGEDGRTPLSHAARCGHEAVVKLLLETGKVDADLKDEYGQTPLWWAAGKGYEAVVKLLLETGKVEADSKDKYGRTPLSRAAEFGREAVVKLLLETGKVEADSKGEDGQTPLSRAAENGYEAVVKLLLETGKVEADSKDKYGRTPLSWAAEFGYEAIVKLLLLLETGKVEADSKDEYGQTPLSWAAMSGREAVVKLLLETGKVEADSGFNDGRTPLWYATENGHEAVVKLLRKHTN
jgi:ankyrin repeat protein